MLLFLDRQSKREFAPLLKLAEVSSVYSVAPKMSTNTTIDYAYFEFILHGVITNTVAFVGLLGNLVCILVLRRPQMRHSSTNVILAALATFDAVLIVTSVLMLG